MKKKITIVRASRQDVDQIYDLMVTVWERMEHKEWYIIDDRTAVESQIEEKGFTLLAMVDGAYAGFFRVWFPGEDEENLGQYLSLSDQELEQVAHMESAAVKPEFRGLQLQHLMMQEAEAILKNTQYHYWMGTADPSNHYSVDNFVKLGYETICTEKKYGGVMRHVFLKKE